MTNRASVVTVNAYLVPASEWSGNMHARVVGTLDTDNGIVYRWSFEGGKFHALVVVDGRRVV